MDLINELSKTYGKDKAFRDDELFDKIVSMTYPGIRTFFNDYVIAAKPLPFEEVLDYAGVNFARVKKTRTFTMGGPELGYNPATKQMKIVGIKSLNEFGQKLGYQVGDEIATINGKKVTIENFREVREKWLKKVKEGSNLSVKVYRPTGENQFKKVTLKAKAFKADTKTFNSIAFSTTPTPEQLKIREAWLKGK
jgi:predicted metalloprotease with PDZ domain